MKRISSFLLIYILLFTTNLHADEGMWMLPFLAKLNIKTMQELGCELTAEDIYSINHSSIKDAVIIFGPGCTGEIISENGLILTNHHCGFDNIQNHSTLEHDLLKDGFWAMSQEEELLNPGLTVKFLVRIEDVTKRILSELHDEMTASERVIKIDEISTLIQIETTKENHYTAKVEEFYGGNNYFLMVYEVFADIRLVGAPPVSIGKFGADTDNWMWPRHTGDFSLFRVYCAPDGTPAEYDEKNVPLSPKHYFPISIKGIEKGDFSMILGFPGGTQRFMSSYGIKELMNITNINRITIREQILDIQMEDMMSDAEIKINYATKYSQLSNYYKFSIGQNLGITRLGVLNEKEKIENDFTNWIAQDSDRYNKYGNVLNQIQEEIEQRKAYKHASHFTIESFYIGTEVIKMAWSAYKLYNTLNYSPKATYANEQIIELKNKMENSFSELSPATDKKILTSMLNLFYENVPDSLHPDIFLMIKKKYKNDFEAYANVLFAKSIFTDKSRFDKFINSPSKKVLNKDPGFIAAKSIIMNYIALEELNSIASPNLQNNQRLFIKGLLEMQKDKIFYPDANFTMRLTYGTVQDYFPRDAVHFNHFTTLEGIMEKKDPDNWEFVVDEKLIELYERKDFGKYGMNKDMPICFLTNNDITGGNSGSPVINGKGEIIGLAFDGNWEAMSGDVKFEPELQRCISVDIRYVLFIIDKFANAGYLLNEMTILE